MVSPDAPHSDDIAVLHADLERRLGKSAAASTSAHPPTPKQTPGATQGRAWMPIALAAVAFVTLGLGAGWFLFGADGRDQAPVTVAGEPASTRSSDETTVPSDDDAVNTRDETGESTTPEDPLDLGESLLGDSQFRELLLDDLLSADELDELQRLLDDMPTADELNELLGGLEGDDLTDFLDPDRVNEMNELFEELFGQ